MTSKTTDLLRAFCPKENNIYKGRVLDPFLGSGTTSVCCQKLNNNGHAISWVGCEMEERWINVTNERLKNVGLANGN